MSKKKCFVNGASFTIKNCGIQLEDLITTTVGKKKNELSLAVAVNNELVQKSEWKTLVKTFLNFGSKEERENILSFSSNEERKSL